MRICSFIPGATEVVAALGLAEQLVGISHECDFPPSVRGLPVMIQALVAGESTSSLEIDHQVKTLVSSGQPLYRLDERALVQAQPDVILTQDLCHVCAVTPEQLARAVLALTYPPRMLTLSPTSLTDVLDDVQRIAEFVQQPQKGELLSDSLRRRLDAVRRNAGLRRSRPRVVCLEWLDPLYLAGHWVPEMVELAGGENTLGTKDSPSRETTWAEVAAAEPDIIIVMPCGYPVARTIEELSRPGHSRAEWMDAVHRWPRTYVVDAASYFSRPGPRLVDGVELLALLFDAGTRADVDPLKARRLDPALLPQEPQP
jgi:iron complex transport system substrate-binding protein